MIRRMRVAGLGLGAMTVCLASVYGVASARQGETEGNYEKRGHNQSPVRCLNSFEWPFNLLWRCEGYLKLSPERKSKPQEDASLLRFLESREWHDSAYQIRRRPVGNVDDQSKWPVHTVQAIKNLHRLKYRSVPANGVVLARITVPAGSLRDSVYGLDGTSGFGETYYLVGNTYKEDIGETTGDRLGARWRIADWYILGVKGSGASARVEPVGNRGKVAWCGHTHDDTIKVDGARFLTCAAQDVIQEAQRNRELMSLLQSYPDSGPPLGGNNPRRLGIDSMVAVSKRIVNAQTGRAFSPRLGADAQRLLSALALMDFSLDPVWITCGIGCCIAET